jgi:5-methylcytosine-specific restriction endonuclease McrA
VTWLRFRTRRRWQKRAADTPRSNGRPSATRRDWDLIRLAVVVRAGFHCQACRRRAALDVHHVVKRAQGGSDFDLDRLVALCRRCHELTDAPYIQGRLVITPLGDGVFRFALLRRPTKWDAASGRTQSLGSGVSDV